MKKILFLFVLTALTTLSLHAQSIKWGIRAGVSTADVTPKDLLPIVFDNNSSIKVSDASYGFHGGLWFRATIADFMIQPELVLNTSNVTYTLKAPGLLDTLAKESFLKLDLPIMLGFKLGSVRIMGGPVGHLHLNSSNELTDFSSYTTKFDALKWGWQAGIGFDLGRVGFDLRYEGNFNNFGDHIMLGGQAREFSKSPSRTIASLAFSF
ncbi:MAG: PorT family protein [Saprospiraceae bacterium]|nr:PorT family protein [Saprospiraceae bacterium]